MCGVLRTLAYLPARGVAHCAVRVDNVTVEDDGVVRVHSHGALATIAHRQFVLPQPCYVSPAMAAGKLPTPACDMLCYGLACLEV
jgi:hypothetical protein